MKGYSGKNLRVNLSDQIVSVEEQPEKYYKFFFGWQRVYRFNAYQGIATWNRSIRGRQ